jgi:uncharacterized lipoprotein YddW (UPF0748 family)
MNMAVYTAVDAAKDKTQPTIKISVKDTEPTNGSVKVIIRVTDSSGIKLTKWASGSQRTSYFSKAGYKLKVSAKGYATVTIKKNGTYTFYTIDKAGNTKIKWVEITNIDKTAPTVYLKSTIMNQKATITISSKDTSGIASVTYVKGKLTDTTSAKWISNGKSVADKKTFTVKTDGNYSVLVKDKAGNSRAAYIPVELEMRAVWISYLEFKTTGYTKEEFQSYINEIFDNCVDMNMNTVVVQVRPFGDALYPSKYFPWSKYISGEQGKDPGFDPLAYMVTAAHDRGLKFHAWINPYRITLESSDFSALAEDNYARKWYEDDDEDNDRNVLAFDTNSNGIDNLYYNPASVQVRNLIIKGVQEIVKNYDVDGIHMDDYFYPSLGTKYQTTFDSIEYSDYVISCITKGTVPNTIVNWRRNNVNYLVKRIYSEIKKIDSKVVFGISPQGNIDNLYSSSQHYTDVEKWMSSNEYIDYICPQLYWTFQNKIVPFDKNLDRWLSLRKSSTVNVYVGIPTYLAGSSADTEWKESDDVLKRMVEYGRETGLVDGYIFFRYAFFYNKTTQTEVENLLSILD